MSTEIIYTDGACSGNGSSHAKGGFGMYIAKSSIFGDSIKINKIGQHMRHGDDVYYVTNIRMEGLAIVSTLALYKNILCGSDRNPIDILNNCKPFSVDGMKVVYGSSELCETTLHKPKIEIITDSQFWINVIEAWMPGWVRKGIVLEKKNPDILLMLRYYTEWFNQNDIPIKYTFVRSHQKGKRSVHADGNDMADVLATSAVANQSAIYYQQS